jgi:hypothetical protein
LLLAAAANSSCYQKSHNFVRKQNLFSCTYENHTCPLPHAHLDSQKSHVGGGLLCRRFLDTASLKKHTHEGS